MLTPFIIRSRRRGIIPSDISGLLNWQRADTGLKTGGARQFTAANSESLSLADDPAHDLGTGDFLIHVFFYMDSGGVTHTIASKHETNNDYWILKVTNTDVLNFDAFVGGGTKVRINGTTTLSTGAYYSVVVAGDRDSTANTKIYLDGVDDTAGTPIMDATDLDNTGEFALGELAAGDFFDGRLARFTIGKPADVTTVVADFVTDTYNSGNGVIYSILTAAQKTAWATAVWNNMTEASGSSVDSHAAKNLTDNNTVTAADGPAVSVASDSTGNGNTGLAKGSNFNAMWSSDVVSGATGLSLGLDGVDQHVETDYRLTEVESGSCWLKANAIPTTSVYLAPIFAIDVPGQYRGLFFTDDDKIQLWTNVDAANPEASGIVAGQWYHVVWVRDGDSLTNGLRLYVDSVLADQANTNAYTAIDFGLWIGSQRAVPSRHHDGNIDDVRIYNRSLTADEITYLYNSHRGVAGGTDPGSVNLQAHWKFDDGPQAPSDGDPVIVWESKEGTRYQFQQVTGAKRPAVALDENGINNKPAVEFDGANLLVLDEAPLQGKADLTLFLSFETGSTAFAADQVIVATSDEAAATNYLCVGIDSAGNVYCEVNDAGTVYRATGDTVLSTSTVYLVTVRDTGAAIGIDVNESAETIAETGTYKGIADLTGLDNTTLGGLKHTSEVDHFEGKLPEEILYSPDLVDADETSIEDYATSRYV